jgi:hypothetical protein
VQLLHPGVTALGSRTGNGIREWHIDGILDCSSRPSLFHAICTECTSATEFNTEEFSLEEGGRLSLQEINMRLNTPEYMRRLTGAPMPHNRYVTWGTHVHRSTVARHREFRFFFRVTESDLMTPVEDQRALVRSSVVHGLEQGWPVKESITQRDDGIILHKTW